MGLNLNENHIVVTGFHVLPYNKYVTYVTLENINLTPSENPEEIPRAIHMNRNTNRRHLLFT